jgi:hypothetical protein
LIDWLSRTSEQLTLIAHQLHAKVDQIRDSDDFIVVAQARSTMLNCLDFLERAEIAGELMSGVVGGRVRDAFVEGLRCGLIHERLMSLMDGRFTSKWPQQLRRYEGANTTNEAHVELWATYQSEVDKLTADGETSYTEACRQVATSHGVSARTVGDHTVNRNPQNRGRHGRKPL